MENTLDELRALSTAARRRLAQVRQYNRDEARKPRSQLVHQHMISRKSGLYPTIENELLTVNKILDSDTLAPEDRKTFNRRRKILVKRLTTV